MFAQDIFNESVMKEVQTLIMNKEHDKADSILNHYQNFQQGADASFLMDLTRCLNGYLKIQTRQDVSVIVPYAESGKRAFTYIKNNINEDNASQLDCWPLLTSYAEIFNYMKDSIIDDIASFSGQYYDEFGQKNLYSYYTVAQNTYQYHFSRFEWQLAIDIMRNYNRIAIGERDSTVRVPISSAFIGSAYLRANNYKEAKKWFIDSYKRFQKFEERIKFRAYCELLSDMAYMYHMQGNNENAYEYALEACETNKSNYGKASSEYVNALAIMSDAEFGLNKTELGLTHMEEVVTLLDSIPQMREAEKQSYRDKLKYVYLRLNIKKDVKGNNSIATENSFILDATNDFVKGRVDSAISKFRNLLDYYDDHFDFADIGNYIFASVSLSNALVNTGNYSEADSILNRTIGNLKKNNVDSQQIRSLYEAKGYLYHTIRNVDMALFWYNKAIEMYSASEENSLPYCMLISNLSMCQLAKENLELAKKLSDRAYEISTKLFGDNSNSDERLLILNNLATIYSKLNEFSKGEELYKRVIVEATSQQDDRTKAIALINLSEINLLYKNDLSNAEKCLHEVMKMDVASFIKETAEMNLLFVQILQEEGESLKALASYNDRIKNEMANMFEHFSEAEREEYWTHISQSLLLLNNLSAMTFNTPQSLKMAYNNTIYTKNMLINSGKLLGQLVNDCSSDIQEEYTSMVNMKIMLSDKHITKDSIDIYREKISQKEKGIIASIPNFGNKLKTLFKTCDDVQRMLSDNEIAIEFISLPQKKPPFDENLSYAAMLQTKSDTIPILIQLCSESELENIMDTYNNIGQKGLDSLYASSNKSIYQMIWKKLEPYIPVGSTIYYSPTGFISKINLSAISNGYNRLAEVYSFHEVSSTGIIDKVKHGVRTDYYDAAIYGDINYYEDIDLMAEKAKAYTSYTPGEMPSTRSLNRGTWDLIPGTKEEIETISELFRDKGLKTYVLTQNDANEESFKYLDSNAPTLIHIATHGFYISPEEDVTSSFFNGLSTYTEKDHSMLYSGLLFAGANNAWTGKDIREGVEDGILTADEISRLDLSSNKLIVLSACDTGLGDIDYVDGVFGLQRGLKRAGVKTILMSLWKVPDEETKELMAIFYKELLSGKTPYQSLKTAQEQLIDRGKSPYYWAGFILLD